MRHQLKPQAYLRYGDDFVLFCPTRRQAYQTRQRAAEFLDQELSLALNPKNDIVVAAASGLKFLGHIVGCNEAIVDGHTTANVLRKADWHNASSYRALPLLQDAKSRLDWILLEKYVDI